MADVQLEHGHTRIADTLLEALIRAPMPGRHKDVVLAIIRLTFGYQRTEREMGSTLIDSIVRIGSRRVRLILSDLERWRVIRRSLASPGRTAVIGLVKDFEAWSIGPTSRDSRALLPEKIVPGSSRDRPTAGPGAGGADRPAPPGTGGPAPPGTDARENLETTVETSGKAGGKRPRKTDCPESLDPHGYERVREWASHVAPKTVAPTLDSWVEDALGYYRREGKRFVDWPQAVMDNIRSRVNRERKRNGDPPLPTIEQAKRVRRKVEELRTAAESRAPPELALEDPQTIEQYGKLASVRALFDE